MESLIIRNSLYGHLWQQCPLHGVSFTLWFCVALEGLNTFTGMNGTHGNQHAKLWAGSPPQSAGLLISQLLYLTFLYDFLCCTKQWSYFDTRIPVQICENIIKKCDFNDTFSIHNKKLLNKKAAEELITNSKLWKYINYMKYLDEARKILGGNAAKIQSMEKIRGMIPNTTDVIKSDLKKIWGQQFSF